MPDESFKDELLLVSIRSFVFCGAHGCEFCNACYSDHRFTNNVQIMGKLHAAFPDFSEAQFMDRPPISYVFENIVDRTPRKAKGSLVYECQEHHTPNCSSCFHWAAMAVKNIKLQAKSKNSKVIPIDISREEKLEFLRSMGVDLLPSTRLSQDALEKKFRSAIDASQSFSTLIPEPPFDPSTLSLWSKKTEKPLVDMVRRKNMREIFAGFQANIQLEGEKSALDRNAFMRIRQMIMTVAHDLDQGRETTLIQDKESKNAICIRVVEVRMLDDDTPVMIVLYRRGTRDSPSSEVVKWVEQVLESFRQIVATAEEQKFLLAILNTNARRLASTYAVKRHSSGLESAFALSFLLPVGPINQRDMGRLTQHTGCVVCGTKTNNRCSRCHAVEYCGAECQLVHWSEHKLACKSLQGGDWVEITFSMNTPRRRLLAAMGKNCITDLNVMSGLTKDSMKSKTYEDEPALPTNIHSQNLFLIKMQRGSDILIYDRTRSIEVYLYPELDPNGYEQTMSQMHTGQMGMKIYRWAKRVGENRLSVCLNKPPPKDPQW
ncbi:hypothetical protein C8R42DRAFT_722692 [Lentinula raphanica]|nr:hypothetical protein C8R42DRAFT_722692 [Lentinula raphanica]